MFDFLKKFKAHIQEMETEFNNNVVASRDIYSCLKIYESNNFKSYGLNDIDQDVSREILVFDRPEN